MSASTPDTIITVSAVVFRNSTGHILTVRKHGTTQLMFPGGKPEPGETPLQTALRETAEEIGVILDPENLSTLGEFVAPAANEPNCLVKATVFCHEGEIFPKIANEIAELRWVDPTENDPTIAPLLRQVVFPELCAHAHTTEPNTNPA